MNVQLRCSNAAQEAVFHGMFIALDFYNKFKNLWQGVKFKFTNRCSTQKTPQHFHLGPRSLNHDKTRGKCPQLTSQSKVPCSPDRTDFPACIAAWRTEKQDGWRRKPLQTPRQRKKRLDNKRTSEQTGLTAGPGSVGEAMKITQDRVGWGREGGEEGVRYGGWVPPHNPHSRL